VIDDYQTQETVYVSSSGGAVTFDVNNLVEGLLDDDNSKLEWQSSDPMNGMTWVDRDGFERGVVFDWDSNQGMEFEVTGDLVDMSKWDHLMFRAAQGTRHPNTDAFDAPMSFTVALVDTNEVVSAINFGVYGRISRTYLRDKKGAGVGWANEFNTVRIRLTDFEADGSGLDLQNIRAVRFLFGATFGASTGRLGLDDLRLIREGVDPSADP
jgi:hypothetical protein